MYDDEAAAVIDPRRINQELSHCILTHTASSMSHVQLKWEYISFYGYSWSKTETTRELSLLTHTTTCLGTTLCLVSVSQPLTKTQRAINAGTAPAPPQCCGRRIKYVGVSGGLGESPSRRRQNSRQLTLLQGKWFFAPPPGLYISFHSSHSLFEDIWRWLALGAESRVRKGGPAVRSEFYWGLLPGTVSLRALSFALSFLLVNLF